MITGTYAASWRHSNFHRHYYIAAVQKKLPLNINLCVHAAASNLAVVEMGVNSDFAERYRRAATRVNEMCVFRPPPSQKVAYVWVICHLVAAILSATVLVRSEYSD